MIGQSSRLAVEGGVIVSHAPPRAPRIARVFQAAVTLAPLVLASVLTLAIAWELRTTPLTWLDGVLSPAGMPELYPSNWLNVGHAMVPVVFLLTSLVNRRYGEHYAIAHVLASWVCAAFIALAMVFRLDPGLPPPTDLPSARVAAAFLGAMTLGQLAGVFVFDRTRGVLWWHAPLYGALTSSFAGMFLFYIVAYIGGDWIWLNHMSVDAGVKAAMSFALLVPYFVLRPIVRPIGGLGGY